MLNYTTDAANRTISFWKGECCLMEIHINAPLGSIANRIKQLCDIHAIHELQKQMQQSREQTHDNDDDWTSVCSRCSGSGDVATFQADAVREYKPCPQCSGSGYVDGESGMQQYYHEKDEEQNSD